MAIHQRADDSVDLRASGEPRRQDLTPIPDRRSTRSTRAAMSHWWRRASSITARSTSMAPRPWSAPKRRRSISAPAACSTSRSTTGTTDANGVVVDGTHHRPGEQRLRRLSPRLSGRGAQEHRADHADRQRRRPRLRHCRGGRCRSAMRWCCRPGHDISFGGTSFGPSAASGADAHISIGNANFTSALYGRADGDVARRGGRRIDDVRLGRLAARAGPGDA